MNDQPEILFARATSKFYDNVDKVISMQLIERQVKDKRTLTSSVSTLFNQKRLPSVTLQSS